MTHQTDQQEKEILHTVRRLTELMIARDTASMDKILDKNYTLTHMTGYVQPKSEWFQEVSTERMKYYSAEEVSHSISIRKNEAAVTIRNLVDARIWGARNTWRLQQKMQLENREGRWIIISSVASTF